MPYVARGQLGALGGRGVGGGLVGGRGSRHAACRHRQDQGYDQEVRQQYVMVGHKGDTRASFGLRVVCVCVDLSVCLCWYDLYGVMEISCTLSWLCDS